MTANLELHEACCLGDVSTLRAQLRCDDVDVNLKDADWKRRTALHWACAKGYVECIRLLLEHGANGVSRMTMGWTPAHCSAEAGKLTALRALHAYGVPLNRPDKYGDKPKRIAEIYGHTDCVAFLTKVEDQEQQRINDRGVIKEIPDIEFTESDDDNDDDGG